MEQNYKEMFPNVKFGENVKILTDQIQIGSGTYIGDNVTIDAEVIAIGSDCVIENGVKVKGIGSRMKNFTLGDNCFIGFANQILVPSFKMMDYSQLHNSGLHSGYSSLAIGYNCWIGQNTILNSTEALNIHNNVRIGTGSQLWTHVASGELFEGCTLYGNKPLTLEDDVWIVGGAVISPGLILSKKSIIMTGSVLTKSTEERHTYAGVPAKDVTDKMYFWKELAIDEKLEMLKTFILEFTTDRTEYSSKIQVVNSIDEVLIQDGIVFLEGLPSPDLMNDKITYFDILNKKYTKRRSAIEIDWIKFCVGFRMRFIPAN